MLFLYSILGRFIQLLPKFKKIKVLDMEASFYSPAHNHYTCIDLIRLSKGIREPELYKWLNSIQNNSIYFDIGTSYGQEVTLLSNLKEKNIKVIGFDCSLIASHFCAINKKKNKDNFDFVFAAVSDSTGDMLDIETWSNIYFKSQYSYNVMTLKLDDYSKINNIYPTHLKIDTDVGELKILKGAENILKRNELKEIFIEINSDQKEIFEYLKKYEFEIVWEHPIKKRGEFILKRHF